EGQAGVGVDGGQHQLAAADLAQVGAVVAADYAVDGELAQVVPGVAVGVGRVRVRLDADGGAGRHQHVAFDLVGAGDVAQRPVDADAGAAQRQGVHGRQQEVVIGSDDVAAAVADGGGGVGDAVRFQLQAGAEPH